MATSLDNTFYGAFNAQNQRNREASASNMNQSVMQIGLLQKMQAQQQQRKIEEILKTSPDQATAMARLQKEGGTLGVQVAQHLGQAQEQQMKMQQMGRDQAPFTPGNLARLTTGGQPARAEIPAGADEQGGGPGAPAQAEIPGQLNYDALGQQSAATSPKAFEAWRTHQASEGNRKATIEQARQTAQQNFLLRIQQLNNVTNETKRKQGRDQAQKEYQQEQLKFKRMEADPFGMMGISPTPQAAPQAAPQPLPQSGMAPSSNIQPASMGGDMAGSADPVSLIKRISNPADRAAAMDAYSRQNSGGQAVRVAAPNPAAPIPTADLMPGVNAPPTPGPGGDEFLSKLPPRLQGEVKKYSEGRMPVPTGFALKSPYFQQLMQAVTQYDPNFSASRYQVRLDFEKGKMKDSRLAFGQSLNHLGTLQNLADAMDNKDTKRMNQVINMVKNETGNPAVTNFQTAQQAVGEELMRAFRQVNASESEVADWKRRFDPINSPAQLKGAVQTAAKLLDGRLHEMNNIWDTAMGTKGGYPNIVSKEAQDSLARFLGKGQARRESDSTGLPDMSAIDAEIARRRGK